jgi:hypothetical protein
MLETVILLEDSRGSEGLILLEVSRRLDESNRLENLGKVEDSTEPKELMGLVATSVGDSTELTDTASVDDAEKVEGPATTDEDASTLETVAEFEGLTALAEFEGTGIPTDDVPTAVGVSPPLVSGLSLDTATCVRVSLFVSRVTESTTPGSRTPWV